MIALADRIAGAPISWGVCEVPGWGFQLDPSLVLAQMRDVGLVATELGPEGFLPRDPQAAARTLRDAGLSAVGGFVPVVLHDPAHDPLPVVDAALDSLVAAGAGVVVLAAATGRSGYDERPALDDDAWARLLANLDRLAARAASRGVVAVLHPHMGTLVERREEVDRVLAGSDVPLCLDTGHLLVGGTDPVDLVRSVPERVLHVHLKDVDASWAAKVRDGDVSYTDAVAAGLYRPLGRGDVDVAEIVRLLEGRGYQGWYVLEQDTVLTGPPDGDGPLADVRDSVAYLRSLDD
jgi:inosose dehydratase